jgi:DNA-binding winged helix-turn-helix (wHTH) protein
MRFSFGDCRFDSGTHQLFRAGAEVPLTPKAFQLLAILIEKRPQVVSKEELRRTLWKNTHVSESNLAALVTELRHALGETAQEPRFLRTVRSFGYAFSAPARESRTTKENKRETVCRLRVRGGRDYTFGTGEFVIGRDEDADIPINSLTVSRHHARLRVRSDGVRLEDLGSKNGTFIEGERLSGEASLPPLSAIRLGSVEIEFEMLGSRVSTQTGIDAEEISQEAARQKRRHSASSTAKTLPFPKPEG